MSELLITPRCEATGLPLLISPFLVHEPGARYKQFENYHHANSPESDSLLHGVAGKARRYSWGQMINATVHNRYTKRFAGPDLEISPEDEFKEIILALSGVRPRNVLALSTTDSSIAELNNCQFAAMYDPSRVHHQDAHHRNPSRRRFSRMVLGRYIAEYSLTHDIVDDFKPATVEEFLDQD